MHEQDTEKAIQGILARLDSLEKAVLDKKKKRIPSSGAQDFSGPSGGVRLLISRGFFKTKRNLGDVRNELAKNEYHYGAAQIQTALNRLSSRTGPLAASKQSGKKSYVKRK